MNINFRQQWLPPTNIAAPSPDRDSRTKDTNPFRQLDRNPFRQPETNPFRAPDRNPFRQPDTNPFRRPDTNPFRQPDTNPFRTGDPRPPDRLTATSEKNEITSQLARNGRERANALFKFESQLRKARNDELDSLRTARAGKRIQSNEMHLAGYLLLRAMDKRTVDGKSLERLRTANKTVEQSRAIQTYGRGNVVPDVEKSGNESTYRKEAGRKMLANWEIRESRGGTMPISAPSFFQASASITMVTKAGNCGENGALSTHLHPPALQGDETVNMVSHKTVDHGWSESWTGEPPDSMSANNPFIDVVNDPGLTDAIERIIIDSWAKGPAVFSEDSAFSSNPGEIKIHVTYNRDTGAAAVQKTGKLAHALATNPITQFIFEQNVEELRSDGYKEPKLWSETPVLDRNFVKRTAAMICPGLGTEIKTVGVARSLGLGVGESVKQIPAVVRSAKEDLI